MQQQDGIHVGQKSECEFYTIEVGDTTFRILRRYINLRPIGSEAHEDLFVRHSVVYPERCGNQETFSLISKRYSREKSF